MASVEEIIGELYLADPDSFTSERDAHLAQAKKAGDAEVVARLKKLRKPVLAAWALNVLRREDPDRVDELFALGEQIRAAQRELRGDALRELGAQRDELLAELLRRTVALADRAGHPLGAGSTEQVRQTLIAALSDPETAQRLSEGRLVKSAEYSGFGIQELTDWVAPQPQDRQAAAGKPTGQSKPEAPSAETDRMKRWETDYAAARAERDSTAKQLDLAHAALAAQEREQQQVERRRRDLRAELAEVDQQARTVELAIQQAHGELREARRAAELADGRIAEVTRRMPSP